MKTPFPGLYLFPVNVPAVRGRSEQFDFTTKDGEVASRSGPTEGNPKWKEVLSYRLGSQYRAYFGDCPKEVEPQFLAGLRRGRAMRPYTPEILPFYDEMDETEGRFLAASSDAERAPLRARLQDLEWWTIHLMSDHATFHH